MDAIQTGAHWIPATWMTKCALTEYSAKKANADIFRECRIQKS